MLVLAWTLAAASATTAAERLDVATIEGTGVVGQPRPLGPRITLAPGIGRATLLGETGETLASSLFTSWIVSLVDNNSNSSPVLAGIRVADADLAAACSIVSISPSGDLTGSCELLGSLTGTASWEGRLELRVGGAFVFRIRVPPR